MNIIHRWGISSVTLSIFVLLSACATGTKSDPSDKFLTPISDQTMDLVGDVSFGLQLADSVLLNHYFDEDTQKVDDWEAVWTDLVAAMRAIVYFSSDLVDIAEATEGPDAIEPLIAILAELDSELMALPSAQPYLSGRNIDAMLRSVREQRNIIDALRVAQPAITDISEIVTRILADSDQALADAAVEVFELIESSHAPMLAYGENLTARQNATLGQLDIMDRVWSGDDDAWAELLASDWALAAKLGENAQLTPETAKQGEQFLIDRLATVATVRHHLKPALLAYQAELRELYQIEGGSEAMLRLALLVIESWDKALAQLAHGEKGAFEKLTSSMMKVVYERAVNAGQQ